MIWNTRNSSYIFAGKILTVNSRFIDSRISEVSRIPLSLKITNNNDNKNNSNNS